MLHRTTQHKDALNLVRAFLERCSLTVVEAKEYPTQTNLGVTDDTDTVTMSVHSRGAIFVGDGGGKLRQLLFMFVRVVGSKPVSKKNRTRENPFALPNIEDDPTTRLALLEERVEKIERLSDEAL